MDNYSKFSGMASYELNNPDTIKILLCYLMFKINEPVLDEDLYEIAVSTEIINYFYYTDAINDLISNNSVLIEKKDDGKVFYSLMDKGKLCARNFKSYVPKIFRDKIVEASLRYFAKKRLNNEVKVEYLKLDNGYYVHFRCLEKTADLIDMMLFAPDYTQAQLLGEKILLNPIGFYEKIIGFALGNQEEKYDLTDN